MIRNILLSVLASLKREKVAGKYIVDGEQGKFRIAGVIEDVNPHFEISADYYLPYTISVWNEDQHIT
jgi:hypothetical protein